MLKTTFCIILSVTFSYSQLLAQASKIDSSEMRALRIDPSSARGTPASALFEEIKFIPLETTKESLFGSIGKFRVTEDNYVIHDYETKAVLIFSKTGKYIAKIDASKIKADPNDKNAQNFYGFELKTENDKTLIQIGAGKSFIYFDLSGNLVRKVPRDHNEYGGNIKFSNGTLVDRSYLEKKDKDSIYYQVSLTKDKKKIAAYFPYTLESQRNDENWGASGIYDYDAPDELFYLKSYEYNIYKLTPEKLSLAYQIIFPAINSLPVDYAYNPIYRGKRSDYFRDHKKAFYSMDNTYLLGDNLYFKARNFEWNLDDKKAFIYNLKSDELISVSDIEPDSLSQFLPVTDASAYYDFSSRGFHVFKQGYLYTSYSSLAMFTFKEQNDDKNRNYDPVLTAYFKTQNKKSNPVLIQLKPKKN